MENNSDPLQVLVFDDAHVVNKKKLADFLSLIVRIDNASKQLIFQPDFEKLPSNADKVEIMLLACKARSLIFQTPDGLTQKEIIMLDKMPEGSAKSTIKQLYDSRKIKKNKNKCYFLPGYRIDEVINRYNAIKK